MVWPSFPPSFWGFEGVLQMIPERAMTPPLGLITVAALCPATWQIRLIDHAFEELRDEDLKWADLVMVSAMHAQRADALLILGRARAFNKRTFVANLEGMAKENSEIKGAVLFVFGRILWRTL
jgi:hypothetical protein